MALAAFTVMAGAQTAHSDISVTAETMPGLMFRWTPRHNISILYLPDSIQILPYAVRATHIIW